MTVIYRDKGLVELSAKMRELTALKVVVGYPSTSTGSQVHEPSGLTFAELAAIQEYGAPKVPNPDRPTIPARPFLRSTFEVHREEIEREIAAATQDVILGKVTAVEAKTRIAKLVQRLARFRMLQASKWATPLAESTVAAKGHDTPLRETGDLIEAMRWAVHKGGQAVAEGRS